MDHQQSKGSTALRYATVAELADALDLGSSLYEVGVQVSSVAPKDGIFLFHLFSFDKLIRARSTSGSAFGSHPKGGEFESLRVHHKIDRFKLVDFLFML